MEDLRIRNLVKHEGDHKNGINRPLLEQNWVIFTEQRAYKAESAVGDLVKVNLKNTTRQCSNCGELPSEKLTLKDRFFYCTHCRHEEDREVNVAKNIAQRCIDPLLSGGKSPDV